MKLLLDTHALLWWLLDSPKIGPDARTLIEDPVNTILVSVVSLWEITVKVSAGKLETDIKELLQEVEAQGFQLLAIAPAHLLALASLPIHHRDPFDHLLIAQTIAEAATFLSEDSKILQYSVPLVRCSGTNPD